MLQWHQWSLRECYGRGAGGIRALALAAVFAGAGGFALQACVPDAPAGLDEGADARDPGADDPPATGTLTVRLATDGPGSPDTLTLALNDGAPQSVAADGSLTWPDVPVGEYAIELGGLPVNCTVLETNPRQVTVVADAETPADFTVACVAAVGDLRVTAASYGDDIDKNGYRVELNGGAQKKQIDANGSVTFTDLELGEHSVRLRDVHRDCEIETEHPVTVEVMFGELAEVGFVIECDD